MCTPIEARRAPTTLIDAKFSLPFLVAIAAVRRGMSISDFTDDALHDPQVLGVAQRVAPVEDSSLNWRLDLPPGRVEIVTCDGRRLERGGTGVPGGPESPMTWADVARKFEECASVAHTPPSPGQIGAAQQMARELDSLDDATAILRVLR